MLKKLLASASALALASFQAQAGTTPLTVQIDRTQNPSPVCINRLTSGVCIPIGFISGTGVWTPIGPNNQAFAPSAYTDTTNAGNIQSGFLPPAQIQTNSIDYTKIIQAPALTFSGNPSGATANRKDMTPSEAATLLNSFFGRLSVANTWSAAQSATSFFSGGVNAGNVGTNWVETLRPFSTSIAQSSTLSTIGQIGFVAGSRTSDNPTAGSQGTIAFEGIAYNDNTVQISTAFGSYFEAYRKAGAGSTLGLEVDPINLGSVVTMTPNSTIPVTGMTPAYWAAAGGGVTGATTSTAAYVVWGNGARFDTGLMFGYQSLVTRADGKQTAISMGLNDSVTFWGTSGSILANIYSSASTGGGANIRFVSDGVVFENAAGTPRFQISTATGGIATNGSIGASCGPASPTSSFKVVNGIVVQC